MKSGSLNFLEPSGPLQACNGTALPFTLKVMGESGNWASGLYVITRLEALGAVLLKLQAVLFGSFQTFRSALNVHKHLCDKFKSSMTVNKNILSKCLSSYGNWQFIAVFTKADRWTLFSTARNTYHPFSMSSLSISLSVSNDISAGPSIYNFVCIALVRPFLTSTFTLTVSAEA